VHQTSDVEESAKVFLEELLIDVCGSIDKHTSVDMKHAKEYDTEGKSLKFECALY